MSGQVTLDGEPLPNAALQFVPKGPGTISFGRTDESGYYTVMFNRTVEGAQVGENLVKITTRDVFSENGRDVWTPELVPPNYNHESELIVTVKPGHNDIDFELQTNGWKEGARRRSTP